MKAELLGLQGVFIDVLPIFAPAFCILLKYLSCHFRFPREMHCDTTPLEFFPIDLFQGSNNLFEDRSNLVLLLTYCYEMMSKCNHPNPRRCRYRPLWTEHKVKNKKKQSVKSSVILSQQSHRAGQSDQFAPVDDMLSFF